MGRPDATREEVWSALEIAQAREFAESFRDELEHTVKQSGRNLFGGQKQRLTIARALFADKPLLILDEATSNVDTRTEVLIQKAIDRLMEGKTCFVIARKEMKEC